jgi:hypothetical protein
MSMDDKPNASGTPILSRELKELLDATPTVYNLMRQKVSQLERELAAERAARVKAEEAIHRACVDLQGGADIEVAARRMVDTNRANQQCVIRMSDEIAALKARAEAAEQALAAIERSKGA